MNLDEIEQKITSELLAAEKKFPGWPRDVIHAAGIVAEERGELMKAAVDFYFGRGSEEELIKEAVQVGAMAMRFLLGLEGYYTGVKPKTKYLRSVK